MKKKVCDLVVGNVILLPDKTVIDVALIEKVEATEEDPQRRLDINREFRMNADDDVEVEA